MKVNIKGLVFTGFAAAILSANAMAANEDKTVTSKAYTDATYQVKSSQASIGSTGGTWVALDTEITDNGASAPVTSAIKAYVDSAAAGSNFVENTIDATHTAIAPSGQAVNSGLATKQGLQSDASYKVGYDGGWAGMDSAVKVPAQDSYLSLNTASDGSVTLNVIATTDTSLANADSGEVDVNKIPTAGAVKAYVDAHSANGNFVENTIDATHTDIAPSGQAVNSGLATKQTVDSTSNYKVGQNGSWAAMTSAVTAGNDSTITVTAGTNGAAVISAVTSDVSNGETALVTGDAVYDYVQGITHGNNIPAQDPEKCTDSTPCALVAELNTSTNEMEQHWRVMAVSANQSPAAGTLADAQ